MRAKLGQLQVEKLHFFTQNLANHLNMFLNSLEEANKDTSFPVTDAETSNHLCFKAIAKNEDTQGSLSKAIANNGDENSKKKAIKHFLAVKMGKNPKIKERDHSPAYKVIKNIILITVVGSISLVLGEMLQIPTRMMITR